MCFYEQEEGLIRVIIPKALRSRQDLGEKWLPGSKFSSCNTIHIMERVPESLLLDLVRFNWIIK
jgi:hypothetical protein